MVIPQNTNITVVAMVRVFRHIKPAFSTKTIIDKSLPCLDENLLGGRNWTGDSGVGQGQDKIRQTLSNADYARDNLDDDTLHIVIDEGYEQKADDAEEYKGGYEAQIYIM
jgi:hypothetical protein